MVKVTVSLDDHTAEQLRRAAVRLGISQSHVVRQAIAEYTARVDRSSARERLHLLGVLEALEHAPPTRRARAVDNEIATIRAARQTVGRHSA